MKHGFVIFDRVRVFGNSRDGKIRDLPEYLNGEIHRVDDGGCWAEIDIDGRGRFIFHIRQCRRMIKKKSPEDLICYLMELARSINLKGYDILDALDARKSKKSR